jgi:hypothetical protein
MDKIYDMQRFKVTPQSISFELSGNKIEVPLNKTGSKILSKAPPEYLRIFEIDQDGLGIYWQLLDEDLSVEGLLRTAGRDDLIINNIPSLYLNNSIIHNSNQGLPVPASSLAAL